MNEKDEKFSESINFPVLNPDAKKKELINSINALYAINAMMFIVLKNTNKESGTDIDFGFNGKSFSEMSFDDMLIAFLKIKEHKVSIEETESEVLKKKIKLSESKNKELQYELLKLFQDHTPDDLILIKKDDEWIEKIDNPSFGIFKNTKDDLQKKLNYVKCFLDENDIVKLRTVILRPYNKRFGFIKKDAKFEYHVKYKWEE